VYTICESCFHYLLKPPPFSTLIWTRKGKSCTIAVYLHMFEWSIIDLIVFLYLYYSMSLSAESPVLPSTDLLFFCHRRSAISFINKSPVDMQKRIFVNHFKMHSAKSQPIRSYFSQRCLG
jgi:hypothetical protein